MKRYLAHPLALPLAVATVGILLAIGGLFWASVLTLLVAYGVLTHQVPAAEAREPRWGFSWVIVNGHLDLSVNPPVGDVQGRVGCQYGTGPAPSPEEAVRMVLAKEGIPPKSEVIILSVWEV